MALGWFSKPSSSWHQSDFTAFRSMSCQRRRNACPYTSVSLSKIRSVHEVGNGIFRLRIEEKIFRVFDRYAGRGLLCALALLRAPGGLGCLRIGAWRCALFTDPVAPCRQPVQLSALCATDAAPVVRELFCCPIGVEFWPFGYRPNPPFVRQNPVGRQARSALLPFRT